MLQRCGDYPREKLSISISDEAGGGGTAQFDLSGIGAVQAKLTGSCQWPNSETGALRR